MARFTATVISNNTGNSSEESAGAGLKKGPWTAAEDAVLTEYVKKHGEGNWNAVKKSAGLTRCGKSCRLRWANHLRPNLKKGAFSPDEEKIIIELHAKLGNKWARMASQLPGRTDNEIKNFWNTRMKRRQRAGLPLYPQDQLQHLLHQSLQYNSQQNHSSSSFSSLLSANHSSQPNNPPNFKPINDPTNQYNFSHPIISHHVPHFVPFNNDSNHHQSSNLVISPISGPFSFQYSSDNLSSMVSGPPYEPVVELPSSQTQASSDHTSGDSGDSSYRFNEVVSSQLLYQSELGRSGLLGDLVVEGRAMSRNKRAKMMYTSSSGEKGKSVVAQQDSKEDDGIVQSELVCNNGGESTETTENRTENFSSCDHSSIGIEQSEDPIDISSMDDDLISLLNNFPSSTMPVPEWYSGGSGNVQYSRETPDSGTSFANAGIDNDSGIVVQNASPGSSIGKRDQSLDSCYWNNMPGIC